MHIGVIFDCLLALFAVYGMYAAARLLAEYVFSPRVYPSAVIVRDTRDLEMLDLMLEEATVTPRRAGRGAVLVVLAMPYDAAVAERLAACRVSQYAVLMQGETPTEP